MIWPTYPRVESSWLDTGILESSARTFDRDDSHGNRCTRRNLSTRRRINEGENSMAWKSSSRFFPSFIGITRVSQKPAEATLSSTWIENLSSQILDSNLCWRNWFVHARETNWPILDVIYVLLVSALSSVESLNRVSWGWFVFSFLKHFFLKVWYSNWSDTRFG